ncbi:MAG: VOC family protein [Alphaproteobacteria bacterium]|nr:VOC family protein [Alphaproteobacteria bacterium]MBL6952494.1 VOC family protein [Alphaproteobacteria bacterium]
MSVTTGLHHVAYRCNNAQETVDFYTNVVGMDYVMAISEDRVPSTKEPDPYMHIFFEIGPGSYLAFFELPNSPTMGKDPNTPEWVQHIAFAVPDMDTLLIAKARIEASGLDVLGPIDHMLFKSIYFFDPNGHRLELATNTGDPGNWKRAADAAPAMLDAWNKNGSTGDLGSWFHAKELGRD